MLERNFTGNATAARQGCRGRIPGLIMLLMCASLPGVAGADPATALTGTIDVAGNPAAGARVSVTAPQSGITTSVFSDRLGRYTVALSSSGSHTVEAAWSTFAAPPQIVELGRAASQELDLSLAPDPEYLQRVTSEQWLSLLPEGDMQREFILNCASCHEIEASRILVDGKPRTREQWASAFALMRAIDQYNILPLDFDDAKYTEWLARHLNKDASARLSPRVPANVDELASVRITEFPLPVATELPHDLVVGPKGRIWITAFFGDVLWAMDPASGEIDTYAIRAAGAEGWGQARALMFAPDGTLWIILGGTHELVALDPGSRAFKTFNIGMYAHSLVIDQQGRIWFNDYFATRERIGVFDPGTGDVRHIDIPSAGLTEAQGLPLPYGLQIDSEGRLYSTQMAANTVVMYDTNTAVAKLLPMPRDNAAPRRPAIGLDNQLWVPEWNTGYLTSYNPVTDKFRRYRVGAPGLGAYDAELDPRSGRIWVTGALGSSMVLFDPADESVLEIPLPTNPGYTRHLAVDPNSGDLWSAYSSLPAAQPKVVRIQRREPGLSGG